jgi:GxxExxY protein
LSLRHGIYHSLHNKSRASTTKDDISTYVADYFAYNDIIIEIKALERLTLHEIAQLLNYLNATGAKVGVLINFGSIGRLEWKRMARTGV